MPGLTCLEIVNAAQNELGLDPSATVTDVSTPDTRQLLALLNREGQELFQSHQWTALQGQWIINIEESINTTGDIVANSATITNIPSTAGIVANQFVVQGGDIQIAARVLEVVDATTIRMDEQATGTEVGAALEFTRDTYALPDDFSFYLNQTMWDRTNRWQLIGPISPQVRQWELSGVLTTGPRRRWSQIGPADYCFRIWPPPSATNDFPGTLVFEYVSKNYVLAEDGTTTKTAFTLDTDTTVLDPQALILGVKWRFWQIKGMNYAPMQREYSDYVSRIAARDGGSPDLNLSNRPYRTILINSGNAPEGNFPG